MQLYACVVVHAVLDVAGFTNFVPLLDVSFVHDPSNSLNNSIIKFCQILMSFFLYKANQKGKKNKLPSKKKKF